MPKLSIFQNVLYQRSAVYCVLIAGVRDDLYYYFSSSLSQAFSISQIEGAYCDKGQNYKNLVGFVKGLGNFIITSNHYYSRPPEMDTMMF